MVGVTLDNNPGSTMASASSPAQASATQMVGFEASLQEAAGKVPSEASSKQGTLVADTYLRVPFTNIRFKIHSSPQPAQSPYAVAKGELNEVVRGANSWLAEAKGKIDKNDTVGGSGPMQSGVKSVETQLGKVNALMFTQRQRFDAGTLTAAQAIQEINTMKAEVSDVLDRAQNAGELEETGPWVYPDR